MSDRMKRTLVIETEIDRKTLSNSEQVVKNFFDKYSDKKMKVATPDFQGILPAIRDIEKEIDRVAEKMPHMLGSIKVDQNFLTDVKDAFKDIEVKFTDGSMAKGFDAIMEKTKTLALSTVDLGEYFKTLQSSVQNAVNSLREIGAVESAFGKNYLDLNNLNTKQLQEAIELMRRLKESQAELDTFNGQPLKAADFYSGVSTRSLSSYLESARADLDSLKRLNLETVAELRRRENIESEIDNGMYGQYDDWEIDDIKNSAKQDEAQYNVALANLQQYVSKREKLLKELQEDSYLFTTNEFETHTNTLTNNINQAKLQIQELQQVGGKVADVPIGGNFTEVTKILNEIKGSLQVISDAFKNEDVSMRTMAENGVTSFTSLSQAIIEVYNNLVQVQSLVDTISKKDFNMTNITQTGGTIAPKNSLAEFKQQAQETIEVMNHAKQLVEEVYGAMGKIPGENNKREVFRMFEEFYSRDWSGEISKSKSATKLASFQMELESFIDKSIQLLKIADNNWVDTFVSKPKLAVKPVGQPKPQVTETPTITQSQNTVATTNAEAQHMWQLKAAIDEVSNAIGRKNAGFVKEAEIVDSSVNAEVAKLRELVGVITNEIGLVLDNIKVKFAQSLVIPELDKSNLQASFDEIYNKFVELKDKIGAMKIDVGLNTVGSDTVISSASNSQQSVDGETQSAVDAAKSFVDAANAKKQFVEANKQVAESAKTSEDAVKKEAEAAKTVATDVSNAVKDLAKTKEVFNDAGKLIRTDETKRFRTDKAVVTKTESTRTNKKGETSITTTIIKDFEKLTKEADKSKEVVTRAQKKLDEFLARFQSKSGGNAQFIKGFSKLEGTKVTSDNMEDVSNKMIKLQEEYSKLETNFRKGQSSLNPFVNAITKSENIGNIFGDVERQFNGLTNKSDELVNNFTKLQELAKQIQKFTQRMNSKPGSIKPEEFSGFSEQVGKFNVLKSQVEGSIKAEQKIETDNEKQRKKEVQDYIDLVKQMNEYESKAAKGGSMQSVYEAKVAKLKEAIIANDKLSIMNQEEKNNLLAIEEAHQLKIAEIKQKDVDKQLFKTQNDKLQGKFDAGYLSEANFSNWQNELATYQSYLDGTVAVDKATIDKKKASLTQLYDHLNKISNASRTFFASGGEILSTWFSPEQIADAKNSLMGLYDNVVAERFDGLKTKVTSLNPDLGRLTFTVDTGKGALEQYTIKMDGASGATKLLSGNTKEALTSVQQFGKALKTDVRGMFSAFIGGMSGMYAVGRYFKEGIQYVRELDKALTELKKVTDETEETYNKFLATAGKTGSRIGRTITDVVSATAEFAKLGYDVNTAASMAESALIYANVGDGVDVETGSQSIISTMKAFGVEVNDTMSIVDKFNEVGNNFAITTKGIGDALQVSASAMAAAGNTLDETIALTTAANTIVQNPNTVGKMLCRH